MPAAATAPQARAGARFIFGDLGLATGTVWLAAPSLLTGDPILQGTLCRRIDRVPIDDFEDGDVRARHPLFGAWTVSADAATAVAPNPFARAAHGALGRARAAPLRERLPYADTRYASLGLAAGGRRDKAASGLACS